jgi:queuosine precursor transporter
MKHFPAAIYVVAILLANWLTARFGLIPVGFGQVATAGTWAAAAVIVARNLTQNDLGRIRVVVLMVVGVALSWWLATPQLAVASGAAFALSESADMAIYTPLRVVGLARAVLPASIIAGIIDTYVFLWIAGFPVNSSAPGQLIAKSAVAMIASVVIALIGKVRDALLREPIDGASA